jgi:hypothetical protein
MRKSEINLNQKGLTKEQAIELANEYIVDVYGDMSGCIQDYVESDFDFYELEEIVYDYVSKYDLIEIS